MFYFHNSNFKLSNNNSFQENKNKNMNALFHYVLF